MLLNYGVGKDSRVPWTARRSNQWNLKEINSECLLEVLMLKLKLQYFGHLMQSQLIGKDPDAGKDWRQKEKGITEDEMIGWHHRLNGLEFEQTSEDSEGQGSLACCSPWGRKELDTTERLNNNNNNNISLWLLGNGPSSMKSNIYVQFPYWPDCFQIIG